MSLALKRHKNISNITLIKRNLSLSKQKFKPIKIDFKPFQNLNDWLKNKPINAWKEHYNTQGFVVIPNIIDPNNIPIYQQMYNDFITNKIDAKKHRHDLGNNEKQINDDIENIMQIMVLLFFVQQKIT